MEKPETKPEYKESEQYMEIDAIHTCTMCKTTFVGDPTYCSSCFAQSRSHGTYCKGCYPKTFETNESSIMYHPFHLCDSCDLATEDGCDYCGGYVHEGCRDLHNATYHPELRLPQHTPAQE